MSATPSERALALAIAIEPLLMPAKPARKEIAEERLLAAAKAVSEASASLAQAKFTAREPLARRALERQANALRAILERRKL